MEEYIRPDDYDPSLEETADAIDWDGVPESRKLPEMLYDFTVIDAYTGTTAGNDRAEPKYKIVVVLRVDAPEDSAGRHHFENFVIGTDRDPMAHEAKTKVNEAFMSMGLELLNKLRRFLGAKDWRELTGKSFSAFIRHSGAYANIMHQMYYSVGELAPGTPTAPGRRSTRSPAKQAQTYAQEAALEIPCPICKQLVVATSIVEHTKNCRVGAAVS